MTDKEIIATLRNALQIAAMYARDNTPAEFPEDPRYMSCLVDAESDPSGEKFLNFWIMQALTEGKEKV